MTQEKEDFRTTYERKTKRKIKSISLLPAELAELNSAAKKAGESLSVFIKKAAKDRARKTASMPEAYLDEMKNLRLELRRIGTNLNQAVKQAHSLGKRGVYIENEILEVLKLAKEIDQTLKGQSQK